MMSCRFCAGWLLLACLAQSAAGADDDSTRLLREQTSRAIEQKTQAVEAQEPPPGTLLYEGQIYQVPDQLDALEPAIYVAINSRQWRQLPDFISRYRQLAGHRPALAAMAEGLLAHSQGDYPLALRHMQLASEQEPDDIRIALELARLQFEDNQDSNARKGFARVLEADLPPQAQMQVRQFQQALDARSGWHGSAALGWGYNDNINQGNGYHSCLQSLANICLFERQMPQAISTPLTNYELSLRRRINLSGNHNLQIMPMSYGSYYSRINPSESASIRDYSNNLAMLQLGYQYLDSGDSLSFTPYLEHFYRNRHSDYLAHGVQLEWQHTLNRQWQLGSSLDAKRYEYTSKGQQTGADYKQYQWSGMVAFSPSANTSLYGGIDLTRKRYDTAQASSRDWAVRTGVYHAFAGSAGAFVNAMAVYRDSRNDAFDGFLGAQRHDRQQVYILRAGVNKWSFAGLAPELRVRHSINRSNLDWAFGFRQTEVSLMLRSNF